MYYHPVIRNLIISELIKEAAIRQTLEEALDKFMGGLLGGGTVALGGALGGAGAALPAALIALAKNNPSLARKILLWGGGLGSLIGLPAGVILSLNR